MRRSLRRVPALMGAALLIGLGVSGSAAAKPATGDFPDRLLVTAREFDLTLSKLKVQAGDAIVELYDFGEDPHDLRIQRVGGPTIYSISEVLPEEIGRVEMRFRKASRYRLWCSLANHAELGMVAALRTSKR